MSKRDPKRGAKGNYTVGHCKPPVATRFVKGQSGNPSGRPRGKRNLASILLGVLSEPVPITENGKRRHITKLEATFKQIANRAASGDVAAIRLLLQLFPSLERVLAEPDEAGSDPAADRAVLANLITRLGLDPNRTSETGKAESATETATSTAESATDVSESAASATEAHRPLPPRKPVERQARHRTRYRRGTWASRCVRSHDEIMQARRPPKRPSKISPIGAAYESPTAR